MFKIYVFSAMEGKVIKDGKPVKNAVVTRIADHYNDKEYTQSYTTGEDGKFFFDAITKLSLRHFMLETRIAQKVTVEYSGKVYLGWETIKQTADNKSEITLEESKTKLPILCTFNLDDDDTKEQLVKIGYKERRIFGLCTLVKSI